MKTLLRRLIWEEQGQDLIEYALLAAFIAIVAVLAITAIGTRVNGVYESVRDALPAGAAAS
ncbi:MAG: Flp family type IVb pilin [Acidobacteria bacterium]|nr:MAG: Flp family type IVb pilin [Acidobacteriota bacterium]PYR45125.1 MAG: Flp family type IVb pilin [Acidobacteriota bacterium]